MYLDYFFTKDKERKQEENRLKEEKRKEELLKENEIYCDWYSQQIKQFINEIHEKGFNPTWGFEVESNTNDSSGYGGAQLDEYIFLFDVPALEALAFDMDSNQMIYFQCGTNYYHNYTDPDTKLNFNYTIIPFSDIFNATLEVNSKTVMTSVSTKQNTLGRSIAGGLIAGDTGAIIGGTTGNVTSTTSAEEKPTKILMHIQTLHPDYPIISFEFNGFFCGEQNLPSNVIRDTMRSTFYDSDRLICFRQKSMNRKCNTIDDYHYERISNFNYKIDSDMGHYIFLSQIVEKCKEYVMRIEAIIQQCYRSINSNNTTNKNTVVDIISELEKLGTLKEKGVISEEEFNILKQKLIAQA